VSERGSERSDQPERDKGDTQADTKADTQKVAVHRQPVREFGRYEILEEVSRGAMGIVYRAREKALGRIVALKVLLAGEHASDEQVGRFIREARAIARIRHPNIVPIHDVGEVDGRHYFTMDYIEGDPLSRMIEKGKVDIRRALDIVESIADAAECAHAAGVIHRDIKPSNIMIDAGGRAQITDFGLAKPVEGDTQYTRTGTTIGTPAYMPPEQAKGDVAAITARSDIYSIGAVLYELVTGVAPFEGPSMLDIILDVLHNEPARPRKLNPRVHADVETVILRAMEKDPERRYASAAELRDDIRRFKAGEAIQAHPPSVLRHVSRWSRRHAMLLVWVATVTVGGGVFALVVNDLRRRMAERVPAKGTQATKEVRRLVWNLVWEDPAPRGGKDSGWEERAASLDGRELIPAGREPSLGSVRVTATVEFAPDAKKLEIPVGLLGTQDRDNPVPFYGVIGAGRIRLYGVPDIEQSAVKRRTQRDMRVLIEREAPPLRAGVRYLVKFERRDLDILFQVASDDGEFDETLVVRNMHLSNWRAKNLFPVLGLRAGAKWDAFRLDQLTGTQDEFDAADGLFIIGEYNGAKAKYQAIVETERPASRVNAARLRLGMCSEIKRQFEEAVRWYGLVEKGVSEPVPAIEAKLREPFCRLALGQPEEAERAVTELAGRVRAYPEAWRRHGPAWKWQLADLADGLAGAKRYPAAAGVIALAQPPAGWPRMERAAARAATGLADEARAEDLLALAEACPSADLAPAFALAVRKLAKDSPGDSVGLLAFARGRYPAKKDVFAKAAAFLAKGFVKAGEFARVVDVHRAWPLEEVAATFRDAVSGAIHRKRYSHARAVLAHAHSRHPEHDNVLKQLSIRLANQLCAEGRFGDVRGVYESYPDAALIVNFREAAAGLLAKGDLNGTVSVLQSALRNFGPGDGKLAGIAAEVSKRFAARGTADEALRLFVSVAAYPGSSHAPYVRSAMQTLAMSGRPQQVMGLFALFRAQLPEGDEALSAHALSILEAEGEPMERDNAFRALDDVAPKLAGEAGARAKWLVELGDIACRVGGRPGRTETYYKEALRIGSRTAAAGLVGTVAEGRLAVLYETMKKSDAPVFWNDLATRAAVPPALAEAGKLLSGRSTPEEFVAWRAEHTSEMSDAEKAMYLGLAALRDGWPEDAAEAFARARSATQGRRWPYHVLERLEDMLPE